MVDYTPNIGLRMPTEDELVYVDNDINSNLKKVDSMIAFALCLSTNRPVPFDGLKILEEDTGLVYIYIAATTSWVLMGGVVLSPTYAAKGYMGHSTNTTDFINESSSTEKLIPNLTKTFAAEPNRRYFIEVTFTDIFMNITSFGNPQPQGYFNIRWALGGSVTTAGSLINPRPLHIANVIGGTFIAGVFVPNVLSTQNVTVGIGFGLSTPRWSIRHTSGFASAPDILIVRDIGPVVP